MNDFKAESFLFMVLEVLSLDGNYFEMRVISATCGGKGISIDHGKLRAPFPCGNHFFTEVEDKKLPKSLKTKFGLQKEIWL